MNGLFSIDNKVFSSYLLYGTLSLGKMAFMSFVTGYFRMKHKSFPSVEDAKLIAPHSPAKLKQMLLPHEDVERSLKAHRNDLENVIPFVIIGLFYVGIKPDPTIALWHFRIFLSCRVFHSIAYIGKMRQPFRMIGFFGGFCVFWSMAVQIVASTLKFY